eukprot:3453992-Amphidinium_carterae.2
MNGCDIAGKVVVVHIVDIGHNAQEDDVVHGSDLAQSRHNWAYRIRGQENWIQHNSKHVNCGERTVFSSKLLPTPGQETKSSIPRKGARPAGGAV